MPSNPVLRLFLIAVWTIAFGIVPTTATGLDIFNIPVLKNIDGPVVWVSHGWIRGSDGSGSKPEYWRGGLGIRYHMLQSTDDYELKPTTVERDTSDGKVTVKALYTYESKKKTGPVTVTIGYAVDNGLRLNTQDFSVKLPFKGPYLGVFVVPGLSIGKDEKAFNFFMGGTIAFLDVRETSVRIDSVALKINSSQFVAPEAFAGLSHRVAEKVVGFVELSWEYARLQSIGYDKASLSAEPPLALRDRLPRSASFHAVNITVGITFARV